MTQTFVTVIVPFDRGNAKPVNDALELVRNPADRVVSRSLDAAGIELIAENAISNRGGRGVRLRAASSPPS